MSKDVRLLFLSLLVLGRFISDHFVFRPFYDLTEDFPVCHEKEKCERGNANEASRNALFSDPKFIDFLAFKV